MEENFYKIFIPKGTQYLNEVMDDLPVNTLFDKGMVGCGGTTIALSNPYNYVIAVPFITLIDNKVHQYKGRVLGVCSTTKDNEIQAYLDGDTVKKIMVTYDSLPRIMSFINPCDYSLLVDEYHLLFTQYSFRKDAVLNVLLNYRKFSKFCFMTATVLEDEFLLDELKDLPIYKAEWEDVANVAVKAVKCSNNVSHTVEGLIKQFLTGAKHGNAYIFVNSVEFIREMVQKCGLNDSNARAIWSKDSRTETGLLKGVTTDSPKRINLLTSTCFEGADFYDEEGQTFIVSDNRKSHTLVDISTSFQQIAGRIRNSRYKNTIHHIYTNTRYDASLTYEEYKLNCQRAIITSKNLVEEFNELSHEARKCVASTTNDYYISKLEGDVFSFDPNMVKIDLYNFKITKHLYSLRTRLNNALESKGYDVTHLTSTFKSEVINMDSTATSFENVVKELQALDRNPGVYDLIDVSLRRTVLHQAAFLKYDFLEDAIQMFEFEGIEKMKYVVSNIRRKVISRIDTSQKSKVFKMLNTYSCFSVGSFICAENVKRILQKVYRELSIERNPKSTDIETYFEVKNQKKEIDGSYKRGYTILRPKAVLV